ncbi:cytochrome P450 [Nemania sp. FL0916]|nr:cytochrome P450 [Nemania sp. FL0916]
MALTERAVCPVDLDSSSQSTLSLLSEDKGATKNDVQEVINKSALLKIPAPPHQHYFGLLGHSPDLDPLLPVKSYWALMDTYSPIYQLDLGMEYPRVFVGSRELVNEMADDSRFSKFTHRLHREMRPVFGDGLFSAESTDKAWWKAHRLLIPAFGPIGLSKMFDDMQDLTAQLVLKWDRFGPDVEIECIEDMSRLTFDTIGLCAFGYRFNEFYSEAPHPFMQQLKESIVESGKRANRPDLINLLYYRDEQHRQENIVKMRDLCGRIIRDRLENPKPDAKDLLNVMLHGIDRETGETLGVDNVMYQIPTLLGGGYETTSATLCFIYYFLCSNPRTLAKAQQEVDEIVGHKVLTYDMLRSLRYLDACMKEALRMQHPVSLLTRFCMKETTLGGKYLIKKGQMVSGIWRHFHRDPKIWGEDADTFRPERMLDVNFQKLPTNSWKPFGDGLRACIGRGFAEQEILINLAMTLQKFNVEKADPDYQMELKGQMGVKPIGFRIKVRRRPGRSLILGIPGGSTVEQYERPNQKPLSSQAQNHNADSEADPVATQPISVFYGGNMGTSESLARALERSAPDFGLRVVEIQELDTLTERLPIENPCVIITSSYEGRPPDNAKKFMSWAEQLASKGETLPEGTRYCVFGVGNSDWTHTFHRVPTLVDQYLTSLGCEQIIEAGFANVKRDLVGPWETWSEKLCMGLAGITKQERPDQIGVDVHIDSHQWSTVAQTPGEDHAGHGDVTANVLLADSSVGAAKRHVEVRLSLGSDYEPGDYLAIHGQNPDEAVTRILRRFRLNAEDVMTVQSSKKEFLPAQPLAIEHFLRNRVELAAPITKRQLATLSSWAKDAGDRKKLDKMYQDEEYQQLLDRRYSIIDVLEEVPQLDLPFGVYIDLLLPLAPRLYSIASSPMEPKNKLGNTLVAGITFDVFEAPSKSGHGTYRGVASTYLANREPGDRIACAVWPSKVSFRLPPRVETPMILLAAGTGIAPMRAFIQQRAAMKREGSPKPGHILLFFGCRHPDKDYLYRSELEAWEREGLVEVIPCFSQPGAGKSKKKRHVPDALWENRDRVWDMYNCGACVYTCGSASRLGRSCPTMWRQIWMHMTGGSEDEAHEWLDQGKGRQFFSDVY